MFGNILTKLKAPIPLIVAGGLLVAGGGYYAISQRTHTTSDNVISIADYNSRAVKENTTFKIYGKLGSIYSGSSYLNLVDGTSSLSIDTSPLANAGALYEGEYVVIEGQLSSDGVSFEATQVNQISEDDYYTYRSNKIPKLSMTITNYPSELKHGCDSLPVTVKVKNTGKVTIDYNLTNSYSGNFLMYYSVNGNDFGIATAGTDDSPARVGFKDFGTINPGESKSIQFNGSGWVTQALDKALSDAEGAPHSVGTGGNPNIIAFNSQSGGQVGVNTLKFKFAVINNDDGTASVYSPQFVAESNSVNITLDQWDCDLTDIDESVYY